MEKDSLLSKRENIAFELFKIWYGKYIESGDIYYNSEDAQKLLNKFKDVMKGFFIVSDLFIIMANEKSVFTDKENTDEKVSNDTENN